MARYDSVALSFIRVDENNHILPGGKYEIVTVNGHRSGVFSEVGQFGQIRFRESKSGDEWYETMVPDFIRDVFTNISNVADIDAYAGSKYVQIIYSSNNYRVVQVDFPLVLEQVEDVPGYQSSNIIQMTRVIWSYSVVNNDGTIRPDYSSFETVNYRQIYDLEVKEVHSFEDLDYYYDNVEEDYDEACLNTDHGNIIINDRDSCTEYDDMQMSLSYTTVPFFTAKKGTVELTIDNTVNGLKKYNASKEKHLEYKIVVKNKGNITSYNNVIVTYVPEEVEVLGDSIEAGVYDKENNTITWNVEKLDVNEEVEFTYEATAPEETKGEELIGYTTTKSDQVLSEVHSANTIVTLDKIVEVIDNPDTGMMVYIANTNIGLPVSYLVMFGLALLVVIVVLVKRMIKIKKDF